MGIIPRHRDNHRIAPVNDATNQTKRPPLRDLLRALTPVFVMLTAMLLLKHGWINLQPLNAFLLTHAGVWWSLPVLLLLQISFYSMALPGSMFIILSGFLYPAPVATSIAVMGGVIGGWFAFVLAKKRSSRLMATYANSRLMRRLQSHMSMTALFAWRVLPGMPHAIINIGAGSLGVSHGTFLSSTALGFAVKAYVYTAAVEDTLHMDEQTAFLTWPVLWPLAALTLLALASVATQRRMSRGK